MGRWIKGQVNLSQKSDYTTKLLDHCQCKQKNFAHPARHVCGGGQDWERNICPLCEKFCCLGLWEQTIEQERQSWVRYFINVSVCVCNFRTRSLSETLIGNSHVLKLLSICSHKRTFREYRRTHTRDDGWTIARVSCTSLPASVFPLMWPMRKEPVETSDAQWRF